MFNSSIRWRIIIPYTFLILFSVSGIGIYLNNSFYQTQLQTLQNRLRDDALLIGGALVNPNKKIAPQEANARSQHWSAILGVRVTIIAADGAVLGESHQDFTQMDNHLNRPEIQTARQNGFGSNIRYSQTVKYDMLYVAVPIIQNENIVGYARVSLPLEDIEAERSKLQNTILVATAVTVTLAALLSIFIATHITRPLHTLTKEAKQMAQGEITRHIPSARRDEVGQLTGAFNTLLKKLQFQIHALQSEQGKLASILEQMADGVLIVDKNGYIILINLAAERMFKIEAKTAIGNSLAKVFRQHQWGELWEQCQKTGKEQSNILELPRQKIFIQGIASPLDEALPEHTLMLFQDLTRIQRLETVASRFC